MSFMEIKRFVNSGNTPLNNYIDTEIKKKINSDEDKALDVIIRELCKKPFYFTGFKDKVGCEQKSVSTLPYGFNYGSAVVLNNQIHILGGGGGLTYHYKWDGSSWTRVSSLPYNSTYSSAVVYNNEIHILGGSSSSYNYDTNHYKWDGSSWTRVSTLPYKFSYGDSVVCDNSIHILGGNSNDTNHYKWDGSSWTNVSTLPYKFYHGSAVVLNDEIHIMGTGQDPYKSYNFNQHYKLVGTRWISVSNLPNRFYQGSAVVLNNEIHILGGSYMNSSSEIYTMKDHYVFAGDVWDTESYLPYGFILGSAVVLDNKIHILGSTDSAGDRYKLHYSISKTCIKQAYLQSGLTIHFIDVPSDSITPITNCTKQEDGSLLVTSDGLVEFRIDNHSSNHYSIY